MNQTATNPETETLKIQLSAPKLSVENSSEISPAIVPALKSTASLDTPENSTHEPESKSASIASLHQQFLALGKERHKLTHKLLALLPRIYKEKVYEAKGFPTIYEYAGKLAGLSHSTVAKALKLDEKLKDKPHLQKAIETQGIHKVAIVANLATPENEKMFADKVINMSKPALQEYSKELRGKISGKIQTTWRIELDQETMTLFLKLKGKLGKFGNQLSNKEALKRMLKMMEEQTAGNSSSKTPPEKSKPQTQAKNSTKIPGDFPRTEQKIETKSSEISAKNSTKITRYVPVAQKRPTLEKTNSKCAHENCYRPAEVLHHQTRFSETPNHDSLIPLCRIHHEFAHNGITEPLSEIDTLYRKYRQAALRRKT